MPSPFPGMDPYLEPHYWREFHTRFIACLAEALTPLLRPTYAAWIEETVYVSREPGDPPRWIIPDVTLAREPLALPKPPSTGNVAVMAEPVPIRIAMPEVLREVYLEIRPVDSHEVVMVIELLSPTNKRSGSPKRAEYLAKRRQVLESRSHLVEIDLLRGGERMPMEDPLPEADHYVVLSHADRRPVADVWPIQIRDPLPEIAIPLAAAAEEVRTNLQQVFNTVYDRSGYDYKVRYSQPLEPSLTREQANWVATVLEGRRSLSEASG